ncbi:MAG TPA: cation transporter [Prolixibacteraceae bacterium]|nr:cation transporter [Prolixibacteraceae bacterium]
MKTKILVLTIMFLIGTATAFAEKKTEKVDVKGNCGMCKTRIEKAAKGVDGVSKANWNKETKVLELAYDDSKTDLKTVETSIAKAGYDTPLVKASDETYNALPDCCKYDRGGTKASSGSCTEH